MKIKIIGKTTGQIGWLRITNRRPGYVADVRRATDFDEEEALRQKELLKSTMISMSHWVEVSDAS